MQRALEIGREVARPAGRRDLEIAFLSRPLLWAFGAAALGIAAGDLPALRTYPAAAVWGATAAAGVLLLLPGSRARLPWLAFLLALFALGGALGFAAGRPAGDDISRLAGREAAIAGLAVSPPERLPGSVPPRWRFLLRAEAARSLGHTERATGRMAVTCALPPTRGERIVVSGVLRRPRGRSNPGGWSSADAWRRRGVFATLSLGEKPWIPMGRAAGGAAPDAIDRYRDRALGANRRALSPRAAYLVDSITLGEREAPPGVDRDGIESAFRDSGTYHLLVVSGAQVTLFLLPALWLCQRWLWLRWFTALLAIPLCALYTGIAGGEAPVLRAACMGAVYALGLSLRRDPDFLNMLGFAGLCLLAINPLLVTDPGFVLSFLAVWAVAELAPALLLPFRERAHRRPVDPEVGRGPIAVVAHRAGQVILLALAASVAATLATAPVLSHLVQRDTPLQVLANIPAVLLAALLVPLSLAHAAWGVFAAPPALLTAAVQQLADMLWACVRWFSGLAGSGGQVFPLPVPWVVAALGLLAAGVVARRRPGVLYACVLAAAAIVWGGDRWPPGVPRQPALTFLDVGQGDATVVRLPDGKTLLVDAGGGAQGDFDVGERTVLPALRALRVARLDLVVATHPHEDHIGGLPAVVAGIPVGRFLDSGQLTTDAATSQPALLTGLAGRSIPFETASAGSVFRFGSAWIEVFWPERPFLRHTRSDLNNNSVVLRLTMEGRRVLLAGDAEREAETGMLATGPALGAEILKLGHHGSRHSTGDAWLAAVRPRIAVACCGVDNRFGHPHPETLDRLRLAGVRTFRTDTDGAVSVWIEPPGARITCELTGRQAWVSW